MKAPHNDRAISCWEAGPLTHCGAAVSLRIRPIAVDEPAPVAVLLRIQCRPPQRFRGTRACGTVPVWPPRRPAPRFLRTGPAAWRAAIAWSGTPFGAWQASMTERPAPVEHVREQLEPAAADAVRAYAAGTGANADRLAAVLEDIAGNGLPSAEDCTPREELRETRLARRAKQRPAVAWWPHSTAHAAAVSPSPAPPRSSWKTSTSEAEIHAPGPRTGGHLRRPGRRRTDPRRHHQLLAARQSCSDPGSCVGLRRCSACSNATRTSAGRVPSRPS